jgi:hypothetical protein
VQIAAEISDLVGQLVGALDGGRIDAVLDHCLERRTFENRLTDAGARPRHDLASTQAAAQPVHEQRAVVAAADIVLPRPHQLHRPTRTNGLGDRGKLRG